MKKITLFLQAGIIMILVLSGLNSKGQTGVYGSPIVIPVNSSGTTTFSSTKNNGSGFTNGFPNNSSPDVWYTFTLASAADVSISLCGSDFDTYLYILNSSKSVLYSNDDSGPLCTGTKSSLVEHLNAGTYYIVAEGYSSYTGNIVANISITISGSSSIPVITYSTPSSLNIGTTVNFTPTNTGGAANSGGQTTTTFVGSGLNNPLNVALDASGNLYVADAGNHQIKKVSPAGVVSILAGIGYSGYADGTGTSAIFRHPSAIAIDASGNLFVSDQQNHRIRKITPSGVVTTFAGSGSAGFANGTGTGASFQYPMGLTFDASGNLYVADAYNQRIRKITPSGVVSTFAGTGSIGTTNSTLLSSTFNYPMGLTFDASGNLYVGDRTNHMVRKISTSGNVTTLAGSGISGYADGIGTAARFNNANSVAVDADGTVYLADHLNNMVRKITAAGVVTTLAGNGTAATVDGTGAVVKFNAPYGLCIDPQGNLFLAENAANVIRKITLLKAYSISPALPVGLVFNTETGAITGVPTVTSPSTTYTITAYNGSGSGSTTITFAFTGSGVVSDIQPSANQNYVISHVISTAGLTTETEVRIARTDLSKVKTSITYVDGLGRPAQTVTIAGSPTGKDVIQPIVYDAFGRESKKYLPYVAASGNKGQLRSSALTEQSSFYVTPPAGVRSNSYPFGETVFEASALNRVEQQGAPGASWQISAGHTQKLNYLVNTAQGGAYAVKLYTALASGSDHTRTLTDGGWYAAGQLYVTVTKDENWQSGDDQAGTVEEYKDKDGKIVLKRLFNKKADNSIEVLSTYYVYDDFGNLSYVLPPGSNPDTSLPDATALSNFCYQYSYDGRGRIIEKKLPGTGITSMVYNKRDQLVLSQNVNQQARQEWSFIRYDRQGRTIMTGIYNSSNTRAALQATLESETVMFDKRDNSLTHGYTSNSYPASGFNPLTISYYDDYNFPGNSFGQPVSGQVNGDYIKGVLTGTKVWTLETSPKILLTVNYYNDEGRLIQLKSSNHLGGNDVVDNTYSFAGELLSSIRTHTVSSTVTTLASRYEYDHIGRKLKSYQKINTQPEVLLSENSYNEIGQLTEKKLHDGIQSTRYAYNERGWLKESSSAQFKVKLGYDTLSNSQYNGNIATQEWGTSYANKYLYNYDKLNRLQSGVSSGIAMSETLSYDKMGNIMTLGRDADPVNVYNYAGNRLLNITGGINTQTYQYDANGNAIKDGRNDVDVSYNTLDLPSTISKSGLSIQYIYDATGVKLSKISGSNTTDYLSGIQYQNGNIDFIQTEEGRATRNGSIYTYEYTLKDHLGNTRVTFYKNPSTGNIETLQKDDYYPFGMRKQSLAASNDNRYLYNGKELQEELGQLDYGARFYDPVIGRWNVVDPKAELSRRFSPYVYGNNNPIRFVDPDGMFATPPSDFYDENGKLVNHIEDGSNAKFTQVGSVLSKHYEFSGFDSSQGGVNNINMTSAIEGAQNLNASNKSLIPNSDTYCNYATQNILKTLGTVTGDFSLYNLEGMANTMVNTLEKSSLFQAVDLKTAQETAKKGGLSLLGYDNPGGHGHIASFSVGDNLNKGEVANIGRNNGFMNSEPGNGPSVFSKKTVSSVQYFILNPKVKPSTELTSSGNSWYSQPNYAGPLVYPSYRQTKSWQ
jgi:RHS repeat-associated protein